MSIALSIVMYIALRPEILQDTTAGEFVAYITAAGMLSKPIKTLTDVNEKLQRGMAAAYSVFELLDMPEDQIAKISSTEIAKSVIKVRNGEVHIEAGYDGEFGKIHIYSDEEREKLFRKPRQMGLF